MEPFMPSKSKDSKKNNVDAKQAVLDKALEEITKRFGLKEQKKLYQAVVKGWREAGLWK